MANKTLFKSLIGKLVPATDALNEERAPAYALSPQAQLAQYAATGCLNTTFYAAADQQLEEPRLGGRQQAHGPPLGDGLQRCRTSHLRQYRSRPGPVRRRRAGRRRGRP